MPKPLIMSILYIGLLVFAGMSCILFLGVLTWNMFLLKLCASFWLASMGGMLLVLSTYLKPVRE